MKNVFTVFLFFPIIFCSDEKDNENVHIFCVIGILMFPNHTTKEKSKIEIEICLFKILYMRFKPLSKELMQNE